MTLTTIVGSRKSLYESPLAEEIVVSFEESILSNTTSSTLNGRITGVTGTSSAPENPDDFDGGSIDL